MTHLVAIDVVRQLLQHRLVGDVVQRAVQAGGAGSTTQRTASLQPTVGLQLLRAANGGVVVPKGAKAAISVEFRLDFANKRSACGRAAALRAPSVG
jgi:hypothetical protein